MNITKLLVKNILENPTEFKWSVQGLGMMRIYLSPEVRLHVWDSSLRVPGVSAIHSHPWDLDSTVIAGRYKQHRFVKPSPNAEAEEFNQVIIQCGEKACVVGEVEKVKLLENWIETYTENMSYKQSADEIHYSCPEDGTVTLVQRTFKDDRDHAKVLWRGKGEWIDARPHPASGDTVMAITKRSLQTWF